MRNPNATTAAEVEAERRPATGGGEQRQGRNLTIEGLRGFSASLVICYHAHNMAITGGYFHPHYSPLVASLIRGVGRFGVLLFFMISGYLIVQSLVRYDNIPRF